MPIPWLYIVAAAFGATSTMAFVQQAPHIPVSYKPSTRLHASPRQTAFHDLEPDYIDDKESFDPLNYAKNESAELLPIQEAQEDTPDVGLWAARGLLLVVAILWGTNFASVKYLETLCFHPPCVHPPSEAAFARFGLAALVSLPLLIGQQKDVILGGLECGLWISLGYLAQALALESIPSGECAFICSLTVVVVPLVNALFFGKPIKKINLISAAIALSGVAVLENLIDVQELLGIQPALADSSAMVASAASTATGFLGFTQKAGLGKGDLLAVLQPIGFGVSFLRIEHYVEKFHDVKNRVLTIAAAECVTVGLISLLWMMHDYHWVFPNMEYMLDPHRVAAIAWTGIVTTVVAIYLEGIALETANATEAALMFASEPVWASIFGAWLLHEKLGANSYVGGTIILAACIMSAVADMPNVNEKEPELPDPSG